MTNLEMLQASGGLNYPIDDATYRSELIKNGLDPDAEFDSVNQRAFDLSIADLALTLIFSVKKIMDDGYSLELQDVASLWSLRRYWRNRWGLPDDTPDDKPILRNKSYLW